MAKKNPWDDVIQFDDWNTQVQEEIQNDTPTEEMVNNSAPQEVHGIGLVDEGDDIDLSDMIAGLNAGNASYVKKAKEEEKRMLNEQRMAQDEVIRLQKEERLREKFELESAERDRIAFEEAQAHAEEVRRKQEKSFRNKANKLLGLKPKKKAKKDEEPEQAQETEIASSDSSIDESTEVAVADVNKSVGFESAEQSADVSADNVNDSEEDAYILPSPSPIVDEEAFKASKEIAVKRKKKKVVKEDIQDEESESSVSVPEETVEADVETEIEVEEQPKTLRKNGKRESFAEDPEEKEPSKEKADDEVDSSSKAEKKEKRGLFSFGKPKKTKSDEQPVKPDKKEEQQQKPKEQQEPSRKASVSKPDWKYLATHDELTGLFNQRAYEEDKQKERKKPYAIVFIDVNNLKYANDNFGHAAGNKLIVAVADEMKKLFPNCAYRIGGDEFVAIWECGSVKKIEKEIEAIQSKFHESMEKRTKAEEEYALIYAASFGYSYTDGSKSFQEVSDEADKAMYAAKDAYKKAHPQLDMRGGGASKAKKKKDEPPKEYDELLTKEQRALKSTIKDNHRPVSVDSTQQIIMDVQARVAEVVAILIASPTFDQLFIIHDPNTFIGIVMEMESMIDYSYLYILYEGGPQYKGSDEYLSEVTHIFEAIGNGIKSGRIRNEKDIQKIKGINVFKKIFVDM